MQQQLTDMAIDDALLALQEEEEAEAQISVQSAAVEAAKLAEEVAAAALEAENRQDILPARARCEWDDVTLVFPRPLLPKTVTPSLLQPLAQLPTGDAVLECSFGGPCSLLPDKTRENIASLRERCRANRVSWSIGDSAEDLALRLSCVLRDG
jgi:hypothetical protein